MKLSEVRECIKEIGREELEDLLGILGEGVIIAALECDVAPMDIEEAYQGSYYSDEDFVMQLLNDIYDIDNVIPAFVYIDWEHTAREVMSDYVEDNGHYFRVL